MAHPRLVVRNVRPAKDGVYQFTIRLYWGDGSLAFDFLKWRLKEDRLLSPAAKIYGQWVAYGKVNKPTEDLIVGAVQRVITQVHEIFAKSDKLDAEAKFVIWAGREEHVVDLI